MNVIFLLLLDFLIDLDSRTKRRARAYRNAAAAWRDVNIE